MVHKYYISTPLVPTLAMLEFYGCLYTMVPVLELLHASIPAELVSPALALRSSALPAAEAPATVVAAPSSDLLAAAPGYPPRAASLILSLPRPLPLHMV